MVFPSLRTPISRSISASSAGAHVFSRHGEPDPAAVDDSPGVGLRAGAFMPAGARSGDTSVKAVVLRTR